jgi:hypothetical protein
VAELARKRRAKETARFVEPTQCLPVAKLPEGSNWEYEFKFDWFLRESLAYFQSVIHELASDGCHAVALACTEIPLLIGQADSTPDPGLHAYSRSGSATEGDFRGKHVSMLGVCGR